MIYTIKIGEHCFGYYLTINDVPLNVERYDDSTLNLDLAKFVFTQINLIKNKLTKEHTHILMSLVMDRTRNLNYRLTEEEYDSLSNDDDSSIFLCKKLNYNIDCIIGELISIKEELDSKDWNILIELIIEIKQLKIIKSTRDSCEQCGNYNWDEIYELEYETEEHKF